jgi:hypothetical protein
VVAVGDTETDPEAVPGNDGIAVFPSDPGDTHDGALVDDHDRFELAPEVIDDGLAVKLAVAGALTLEAEKNDLKPGGPNASAGTASKAHIATRTICRTRFNTISQPPLVLRRCRHFHG